MFQDLEGIEETYNRLVVSLSDPAVIGNPQKYRDISKERSELEPLVKKYREYKKVTKAMEDSRVLLEDGRSDPDLKSLAEAELKELQKKRNGWRGTSESCSCPRIRMTTRTSYWRFGPGPAGTNRRSLPRT